MFRPASRVLARAPNVAFRPASRRLITTAPEKKSRSWKNTAVRLGLAFGAVYYYNTSTAFAEHPLLSRSLQHQQSTEDPDDASSTQTLDSIKPRIRHERAQSSQVERADSQTNLETEMLNPAELEEEASHEAAFDPETGEINWDCPCLGGMAHGPCGEDFKAAFSCFVYSQEEPKGMDCIDKFKDMQDCFRAHPDVYGAELEDDEEDDMNVPAAEDQATSDQKAHATELDASHTDEKQVKPQKNESAGSQAEIEEALTKAWHDTEGENTATTAAPAAK